MSGSARKNSLILAERREAEKIARKSKQNLGSTVAPKLSPHDEAILAAAAAGATAAGAEAATESAASSAGDGFAAEAAAATPLAAATAAPAETAAAAAPAPEEALTRTTSRVISKEDATKLKKRSSVSWAPSGNPQGWAGQRIN